MFPHVEVIGSGVDHRETRNLRRSRCPHVMSNKPSEHFWLEDELISLASFALPLDEEIRAQLQEECFLLLSELGVGTAGERHALSSKVPEAIWAAACLIGVTRRQLRKPFIEVSDAADRFLTALGRLTRPSKVVLMELTEVGLGQLNISNPAEPGRLEKFEADRDVLRFNVLEDLDVDRLMLLVMGIRNAGESVAARLNGTRTDTTRPVRLVAQRLFRHWLEIGLPLPRRPRDDGTEWLEPFLELLKWAIRHLPYSASPPRKQSQRPKGSEPADRVTSIADNALREVLKEHLRENSGKSDKSPR